MQLPVYANFARYTHSSHVAAFLQFHKMLHFTIQEKHSFCIQAANFLFNLLAANQANFVKHSSFAQPSKFKDPSHMGSAA